MRPITFWSLQGLSLALAIPLSGCTSSGENRFEIDSGFAPALEAITPASVVAGSVITLTGNNFFTQNSDIGIIIGDNEVVPDAASRTALVLTLPATLTPGPTDVVVRVFNQFSDPVALEILAAAAQPVSAVALGVTITTGPPPVTDSPTALFKIEREVPQ